MKYHLSLGSNQNIKKNHLLLLIKLVSGVLPKGSVHQTFIAYLFDKKLYLSKIMSANRHNCLHFPNINARVIKIKEEEEEE